MNARARLSGAIALPLFLWGCGVDNGIVGGSCVDGHVRVGNRCVAATSASTGPAPVEDPAPPATSPAAPLGPVEPGREVDPPGPPVASGPTPVLTPIPAPDPSPDPVDPPALRCEAPLIACRGACIPVANDPANCGACGKICPSNICVAGACQGATPGDVIVVGHDFADAWNGSAHAKVLANAVGIPTTDPIRILSYETDAGPASVSQARAVIAAGIRGRSVAFTKADATSLESATLALDYDVVLLHDGAGPRPSALGASWAPSLERFTEKGGVIVALDGGASRMPELLTATDLIAIDSHVLLPPTTRFVVESPADVVGAQLLSPYAAIGASVGFVGANASELTCVVRERSEHDLGLPTVLHRVVR